MMKSAARICLSCVVTLALCWSAAPARAAGQTEDLLRQFQRYSGARLVFAAGDLPRGRYHDIMIPLSDARRREAAEICLREVEKYPPGYLGRIGLKAIGVFAACASREGDGFRPFDREIGGYRYYGIWNGESGIAAAYYTDGQLPLTFHHEVFHHVDGTRSGATDATRFFASDDDRFKNAIAGRRPYAALRLGENDRARLRRIRVDVVLKDVVSQYASKSPGEDQAETARHLMTTLADALLQAAEQPDLPGSQRILHCLTQYAAADKAADARWFVDVALGWQDVGDGAKNLPPLALAAAEEPVKPDPGALLKELRSFLQNKEAPAEAMAKEHERARRLLNTVSALDWQAIPPKQAESLVLTSAEATHTMLRQRLRAKGDNDVVYAIWGGEDASGVNWTLRNDIASFGQDAARLGGLAKQSPAHGDAIARTQLMNLRLIARYYTFIKDNWSVTTGTQQVFDAARDAIADNLPAAQRALATEIKSTELEALAIRIPADGRPKLLDAAVAQPRLLPRREGNEFLVNVDRNIPASATREAIRRVQPACVRFPRASGCCISPRGVILTAAHVAGALGAKTTVAFPNGKSYVAQCTAYSEKLDLAVMQIAGVDHLPYAPIAPAAPKAGDWICAIGQPGGTTPSGEATGYEAFHVSTGRIRGFKRDRLGQQMLGGTKHDAWTYWGHSGCPLFDAHGQIVAMHNSWDSATAMRHAVTHEAIVHFLKRASVDFAMAE